MRAADIVGLLFLTFLVGFIAGGAVMRNIHKDAWKDEDE